MLPTGAAVPANWLGYPANWLSYRRRPGAAGARQALRGS